MSKKILVPLLILSFIGVLTIAIKAYEYIPNPFKNKEVLTAEKLALPTDFKSWPITYKNSCAINNNVAEIKAFIKIETAGNRSPAGTNKTISMFATLSNNHEVLTVLYGDGLSRNNKSLGTLNVYFENGGGKFIKFTKEEMGNDDNRVEELFVSTV